MKTIIYSSKTGNTELLANRIEELAGSNCSYCGLPGQCSDEIIENSELIYVGFWTDKGDADEVTKTFLQSLYRKKIFLFGTAGFGGDEAYFSQILSKVQSHLDASNVVVGTYMCQGKMNISVRKRYESMMDKQPEQMKHLIENFDKASTHPDEADLEKLAKLVLAK